MGYDPKQYENPIGFRVDKQLISSISRVTFENENADRQRLFNMCAFYTLCQNNTQIQ
jgi:hypothetical protein